MIQSFAGLLPLYNYINEPDLNVGYVFSMSPWSEAVENVFTRRTHVVKGADARLNINFT